MPGKPLEAAECGVSDVVSRVWSEALLDTEEDVGLALRALASCPGFTSPVGTAEPNLTLPPALYETYSSR